MVATPVNADELAARNKVVWVAGDFGKIAVPLEPAGEEFIARRHVVPGMRVLDVACGTGNLAIPAARRGANVTAVDIAPNLLEQARERARKSGVEIAFDEGDAEALPYGDASFDLVITMFGAMFAPHPERTAGELVRVCRPGGQIAMANWTPSGFIGQMFKITAAHFPPPTGASRPTLWGEEERVRGWLGDLVGDLRMTRENAWIRYPFSPAETVAHYERYFGPQQQAYAALPADRQSALRRDLEDHWSGHNQAHDGSTAVASEYLEVVGVRT